VQIDYPLSGKTTCLGKIIQVGVVRMYGFKLEGGECLKGVFTNLLG